MKSMTKNQIRKLLAASYGRVSDAQSTIADLEAMQNDIQCKLDRARAKMATAESEYADAQVLLQPLIDVAA